MSYDSEGLKKEFPTPISWNTGHVDSPKLQDFLRFGYLTELCGAILNDEIGEPYKTLALIVIPPSAMIATMIVRADEIERNNQAGLLTGGRPFNG